MMVAGIGCRRGTSADEIEAVIALALGQIGFEARDLDALATFEEKAGEPGVREAALRLSLPLLACSAKDLRAVRDRIVTPSERAEGVTGAPSVSEAAALVVAGPGARLRLPRVATACATCAIAEGEGR